MKYVIIYTLLFFNISLSGYAQNDSRYKALFMYKFIQNFEWGLANIKIGEEYLVGVHGSEEILNQLNTLTEGRTINNKSIKAVPYSAGDPVGGLSIIFLAAEKNEEFDALKEEAINSSTVLISESPGLGKKGAYVNFVTIGGKLKFEMNMSSFERAGIKVDRSLKSLAILVQ